MLKRDPKHKLLFASLQGSTAKEQIGNDLLNTTDTIILKVDDQFYFQSGAALRAFTYLGGIYSIIPLLLIVPPFIRNWVYRLVAKNRYKWFGKKDSCRIPSPEERERLLP